MNKSLKLYLMSVFIFSAGVAHLTGPDKFLPLIPTFIQMPFSVIYLTGVLEIILALLLLQNKTQDLAAKTLALYLLLLLPVHIYIAYYGIEVFGTSSKIILWFRTGFQFVFYFWALSLQKNSWVIEQIWKDVLFIHYKIPPEKIKHLVPFELDLYDNQAIISVIPFYMNRIRFPFLPPIPKISNLWELNIRTYVTVNGVKGIYFFTLETDSKLGELIASYFFNLPYRYSKIKASVNDGHYHFKHNRENFNLSLEATLEKQIQKTDFDIWATERYSLFTQKNGNSYQGIVKHQPWTLTSAKLIQLNNQFTKMILPDVGEVIGTSFAKELKVSFQNFKRFH